MVFGAPGLAELTITPSAHEVQGSAGSTIPAEHLRIRLAPRTGQYLVSPS